MNAPADPIQTFIDYYHDYHAITPARRVMQTRVLRELEGKLPGPVLAIDAEQLRAYAAWLVSDQGFHPNTVRQYLNAIKPFITWLWEGKLVSAETLLETRAVKPPRGATPYGEPNPYDSKALIKFWQELEVAYPWGPEGLDRALWYLARWERGTSKWNRVQPYAMRLQVEAIIALALYGGLRRDEIYNLQLEEMHPDNEYIVVRSRKNKEGIARVRAVPWMSVEMSVAVGRWLEFRDQLEPDHDFPWLSLYGKFRARPLRHRNYEMIAHNIGSGWEFHRMRHTAATIMLRSGIKLERVAKIIGHSRIEQTLRYARISNSDVVRAAHDATPTFSRAFKRTAA